MLYTIEPNININPDTQPHAFEQEVKRIAERIKQQIHFQGMPHTIEEDGSVISIITLLPLLEERGTTSGVRDDCRLYGRF